MTLQEIRKSGILELYVLGLLPTDEKRKVVSYLRMYPALSEDLHEIRLSMQRFSIQQGIKPRRDLISGIRKKIQERGSSK